MTYIYGMNISFLILWEFWWKPFIFFSSTKVLFSQIYLNSSSNDWFNLSFTIAKINVLINNIEDYNDVMRLISFVHFLTLGLKKDHKWMMNRSCYDLTYFLWSRTNRGFLSLFDSPMNCSITLKLNIFLKLKGTYR